MRAALLMAALVLGAGQVTAQVTDFPVEVATKTTELSAAEVRQIDEFVAQLVPSLSSDSQSTRKSARQRLRQPLLYEGVSVSFRLAYSAKLTPALRTIINSDNAEAKLQAFILVGEMATAQSADLAAGQLSHPETWVRYQAAFALGLTFRAIATHNPAITPDQTERLVWALGDRIKSGGKTDPINKGAGPFRFAVDSGSEETDPVVIDRIVRSIGAAAAIGDFGNVRSAAINALTVKMAQRMRTQEGRAGDPAIVETVMRAAEAVQGAFEVHTNDPLTNEALDNAAAFGVDCVAYAVALGEGDLSESAAQLCTLGENVAYYARQARLMTRPENYRVNEAVGRGNFSDARTRLGQLVRDVTDERTFGFKAGRFDFR